MGDLGKADCSYANGDVQQYNIEVYHGPFQLKIADLERTSSTRLVRFHRSQYVFRLRERDGDVSNRGGLGDRQLQGDQRQLQADSRDQRGRLVAEMPRGPVGTVTFG
jgi:hypothetical protein